MKLTPLEVKQKRFRNGFRGFDVQEVEEFLQLVSEEMEELARDNNELKERLHRLEEQVEEYRGREKTLKETLVTAQQMADDVRRISEREAKAVLSSAELEGERLMRDAMKRREALVSDIHDIKRQKVQFESSLRNIIEVHLKMLEALSEQELTPQPEPNLTFLHRRRERDEQVAEHAIDDAASEKK